VPDGARRSLPNRPRPFPSLPRKGEGKEAHSGKGFPVVSGMNHGTISPST